MAGTSGNGSGSTDAANAAFVEQLGEGKPVKTSMQRKLKEALQPQQCASSGMACAELLCLRASLGQCTQKSKCFAAVKVAPPQLLAEQASAALTLSKWALLCACRLSRDSIV